METKVTNRDEQSAHEYEMKIKKVAKTAVKDLRVLGLERGYMGPTYDAREEKEQKVKERHKKERERRKEQSKKGVLYEAFVTLNGL